MDAGAVHLLFGSSNKLTSSGNVLSTSISAGNQLGRSLSFWNFGNGPQADLVIAIPFLKVGTVVGAGGVVVVYGGPDGWTSKSPTQLWTQDSIDILDVAEAGDQFGGAIY